MKLPSRFTDEMFGLLGQDEAIDLFDSLESLSLEGLRLNPKRINMFEFLERSDLNRDPIPWCQTGLYLSPEQKKRLSTHVDYHSGYYYFQEPSAMYPAMLLDPQPGDFVLDLCAAPGGKSTQIAAALMGDGLLVTNEINPKRARALLKNIELYGITNAIVTNSTGKHLRSTYGSFFDKILVDAPCSGEGTFRKDKQSVREYENYLPESLISIQRDILDHAFDMLKPGGELVYSTCTFNTHENEENILYMLDHYPCEVVPATKSDGMSAGVLGMDGAVRFWPHKTRSEGHFAVKLRKTDEAITSSELKTAGQWKLMESNERLRRGMESLLKYPLGGFYTIENQRVYHLLVPQPYSLKNKPLSIGLFLGVLGNHGFQPSQALAMSLKPEDLAEEISLNDDQANRYIKGETISVQGSDGFYGMTHHGSVLGWGKITGGFFKNLYEKGWRKSY